MQALPSAFALIAALVLAPLLVRLLTEGGFTPPNYRDRPLPFPIGALIVPAGLIALVPVTLLIRLADRDLFPGDISPIVTLVVVFVPGVALLGLLDDVLSGPSRGLRGHGAAVLRGRLSTGALKAGCTLGLALLVAFSLPGSDADFLLAAAVLMLSTHVFNLLDLRPGRSVKAFVVLAAALTATTMDTDPLAALGIFAAPVLVAGFYDLRELAMLGDCGSNVVGALAGLWLVLTLDSGGQLVALAVLAAVTVIGEFRSISAFIETTPGLRHLDSIGRPR